MHFVLKVSDYFFTHISTSVTSMFDIFYHWIMQCDEKQSYYGDRQHFKQSYYGDCKVIEGMKKGEEQFMWKDT